MQTNAIVEVGRGAGAVRFGANLPIALLAGPASSRVARMRWKWRAR